MGLGIMESREGALVWVQRRNGSWWPGRVIDPTKLHLIRPRQPDFSPVRLLSASSYNLSMEWFNLEKSKRIKAFRCEEFKECIRKVESNQTYYPNETVKYARRDDAIHHALQLEKEMQNKSKKREAKGEREAENVHRTKKSRYVYLPAEKAPGSNLVKNGTSAKPSNSVSSKTRSYDPNTAKVAKVSAVDTIMATLASQFSKKSGEAKTTKAKQNRKSKVSSKSPLRDFAAAKAWKQKENIQRQQNSNKSLNCLDPVINVNSFSKTRNGVQYNGETMNKPIDGDMSSTVDTTLIDVEITVRAASPRGNQVPLVSLMSKFTGKAVIGYPIEIEKGTICNNSDTATTVKMIFKKRRTPVCYVSQPQLSLKPENMQNEKNHHNKPAVASCIPVAKIFSNLSLGVGRV